MRIQCLYNKGKNRCLAITILLVLFISSGAWAQSNVTVSGTVLDDLGLPLVGATVSEKGTSNTVITDLDGKFSLNVAGPQSEVMITYIGFETYTQVVGTQTEINVTLKSDVTEMDEIVVIGYGSARKSDLTGAVSTISGEKLEKLAMPSVAETLTGRLPGVQVTSTEGSPDAEINIRVRGGTSLSQDSSPLIIVDGFPVNSMNDISPYDIDQITVLKDASSTAIYGSRGANGVVIITTKSGSKDGKLTVTFNTFTGFKKLVNSIDVLGPQDYANWQYEYALLTDNIDSYTSVFGEYQLNNTQYAGQKGINWQERIYDNTGLVNNYNLGLRGGSDKLNYSFNYTHYDEQSIMLGSDYRRDNLSFNLKNKPSQKVGLNFTMRYADTDINGSGTNEQNEFSATDSRLKNSVGYSPIDIPALTSTDTDENVLDNLINPYTAVADNDRHQTRRNLNLLGGISWEVIENLELKSDFGFDNYNYSDDRFYGRTTYYVRNAPLAELQGRPALITGDRIDQRLRNATTASYNFKKLLGEDHNLNILGGEEIINYKSSTTTATLHGFPEFFTFDNAVNLSSQGSPQSVNTFVNPEDKLLSFFGRLNYDFKGRYLLTATYRADGSSKFLGDNRWGYFPSAAVAWKISSEEFMKNIAWLDLLKIRASYGEAGNNNIPTGQTVQTFQSSNSSWINGVSNYWSASKILANPDLKWETTVTQNLGLDFEFFKGRISGSLETYKNLTKDLLVRYPVPGTGYDYQYRNMGENQNTGFEASVNVIALEHKDYGLSFSFNYSQNKNKINSLGIMENFGQATNWASTAIGNDYVVNGGQPLGQMYGYQNAGRYEVSDFDYDGTNYTLKDGVADSSPIVGDVAPGTMKLKDINGDGVVNTEDLSIIGNANPKHTGGFVINANAYGFDLMAAFNWSYGNDIYNANKIENTTSTPNTQYRNLSTEMATGNRWTNVDPATGQLVTDPAALTALNANTNMWSPYMERYVMTDYAIEDGSFLRLNTLTLGYTLPQSLNEAIGISRLRFYATCNNVFVLTNYSGPDPEVSTRRNTPYTPGTDYSAYPRSRQFSFGLNLNF